MTVGTPWRCCSCFFFPGKAFNGWHRKPSAVYITGRHKFSEHSDCMAKQITILQFLMSLLCPNVHLTLKGERRLRPFQLCVRDLPEPSHTPPTLNRAGTDQSRSMGCSLGGCQFAWQRCRLGTHCTGVPGHSPKGERKKKKKEINI